MKKKFFSLLSVILAVMLCFAGCTATEPDPGPGPGPTPPTKLKQVTMAALSNSTAYDNALKATINQFNNTYGNSKGFKVLYTSVETADISTQLTGGTAEIFSLTDPIAQQSILTGDLEDLRPWSDGRNPARAF
ncbi:MAG: hypothetical protein MJ072_05250, partial [Clostridia bacterium]|nr:hypothetical protein [Clostridia bacterium]